jgi:DNA-binding LacI/PurR family transcriptional regulator
VADRLWAFYAEAGFRAGDLVPGVRDISREYEVSVNVAQAAMEYLAQRELVEPRRRRGCVLLKDPGPESPVSSGFIQVVTDLPVSGSAYMARYARSLAQAGRRHGLHFYNYDSEIHGFDTAKVQSLKDVLDGRFDAAILFHFDTRGNPEKYLTKLRRKQKPIIFLEGRPSELGGWWDLVASDEAAGGNLMAETLTNLGHRRIVHLGPLAGKSGDMEPRLRGLTEGLEKRGVPFSAKQCFDLIGRLNRPEVVERVEAWLAKIRPTAITLFTDISLPGLMPILRRLGWTMGRDISVLGYDAAPIEDAGIDDLSTIDPHQELVAEKLVEVLVRRLNGDHSGPFKHLIPPTLIEGRTLHRP